MLRDSLPLYRELSAYRYIPAVVDAPPYRTATEARGPMAQTARNDDLAHITGRLVRADGLRVRMTPLDKASLMRIALKTHVKGDRCLTVLKCATG